MEGAKTEPLYFDEVRKEYRATNLAVILLTRDGANGRSAPARVIEELNEYRRKHKIDAYDDLWLVIDKDKWPEEQLSVVAQECSGREYHLALSNPCFEIWLLLHFENVSAGIAQLCTSNAAKAQWGQCCNAHGVSGYEQIIRRMRIAVENAEQLYVNKSERWPNGVGTRVYRLAASILSNQQ